MIVIIVVVIIILVNWWVQNRKEVSTKMDFELGHGMKEIEASTSLGDSWSPLGLCWFSQGGWFLVPFLHLNLQFVPTKKIFSKKVNLGESSYALWQAHCKYVLFLLIFHCITYLHTYCTKYCIQCHTVFDIVVVTYLMTLPMIKFTNIVIPILAFSSSTFGIFCILTIM